MQRITRKNAKAAGLKYYFTGKPCRRGHIDRRYVSSFMCMTCGREKAKEHWDSADAEWKTRRSEYNKQRWQDPVCRQRTDAYRTAHAGESAEYRKEWRALNAEYFRAYYATNKEKRKQEANAWYHENTERALQACREYAAANPDKVRAWGRKSANTRRAITKRVFVEVVDARIVFERDKGICGICKREVDVTSPWEVDHIIPISKGGAHCYANVQLAHRRCNRSKNVKILKGQPTLFQVVP